jgi:hypothetical protein
MIEQKQAREMVLRDKEIAEARARGMHAACISWLRPVKFNASQNKNKETGFPGYRISIIEKSISECKSLDILVQVPGSWFCPNSRPGSISVRQP